MSWRAFDKHLSDELLELYSLNRASEQEVEQIEEHLLICERCRDALTEVGDFIAAMQVGLQQAEGLIGIHRTEDGPILLSVHGEGGHWVARIRGESIDSGHVAATEREAAADCQTMFRELFPGHVCTSDCRSFPSS